MTSHLIELKPRMSVAPPEIATVDDAPVLVVDDEPTLLKMLERILNAEGLRTVAVADPREALRLIDKQEFVAVVSDFCMPHMDGVELLSAVRARWPHKRWRPLFR